jgi:DNA-binding MarR family transcriptional regulator
MAKKQEVKNSEARIIVYLSVVHNTRKHVTAICNKLNMDYSQLMRVLNSMVFKGWLNKHKYRRNMFYYLTEAAPLEKAKIVLNSEAFQTDLELNFTQEEIQTKPEELNPNKEM